MTASVHYYTTFSLTLMMLTKSKLNGPCSRVLYLKLFHPKLIKLTWSQVNRRFDQEYPHLLSLFDLILTIPVMSAACARDFTHMKLVKSKKQLKESSLTDCLMIRLEGETIPEFSPEAEIQMWVTKVER